MKYKALSRKIRLDNLSEGDTINRTEYLEKLNFFLKYSDTKGTYITDRRYREYGEVGLHYYKYETLIKYFSNFNCEYVTIKFFDNWKINCKNN